MAGSRRGTDGIPVDPDGLHLCLCPQVLEYNVLGGKYQRGLTVLVTLKALMEPRELDADALQRALMVGWCVELVSRVGRAGGGEATWRRGALGGDRGAGLKLASGWFLCL